MGADGRRLRPARLRSHADRGLRRHLDVRVSEDHRGPPRRHADGRRRLRCRRRGPRAPAGPAVPGRANRANPAVHLERFPDRPRRRRRLPDVRPRRAGIHHRLGVRVVVGRHSRRRNPASGRRDRRRDRGRRVHQPVARQSGGLHQDRSHQPVRRVSTVRPPLRRVRAVRRSRGRVPQAPRRRAGLRRPDPRRPPRLRMQQRRPRRRPDDAEGRRSDRGAALRLPGRAGFTGDHLVLRGPRHGHEHRRPGRSQRARNHSSRG